MKSTKKFAVLLTAMALTGNSLLCSCTKTQETTIPETTPEETTTAATTTTAETSEEPEVTEKQLPQVSFTTDYEEIVFDGNPDTKIETTDYCYYEGDKYFLLAEKGLVLPGDFANTITLIIDELEKELGMSLCTPDYEYSNGIIDNSVSYNGFNPWAGWCAGTKLPIFLEVDEDDYGYISCGDSEFLTIIDYDMFSDDIWNSVPSYYENTEWRRTGCIDYATIAHELTHAITGRNCQVSEIMTEGIAEYMGRTCIEALKDKSPAIGAYYEIRYLYDYGVPEPVNADNAEDIFVGDYNEIEYADRGAQYVYGRYLCQFLYENYGDDSFARFCAKVKAMNLDYYYGDYDEADIRIMAAVMKELFGEDIFERFGDWCVDIDALQSVDGVYPMPE